MGPEGNLVESSSSTRLDGLREKIRKGESIIYREIADVLLGDAVDMNTYRNVYQNFGRDDTFPLDPEVINLYDLGPMYANIDGEPQEIGGVNVVLMDPENRHLTGFATVGALYLQLAEAMGSADRDSEPDILSIVLKDRPGLREKKDIREQIRNELLKRQERRKIRAAIVKDPSAETWLRDKISERFDHSRQLERDGAELAIKGAVRLYQALAPTK